MPAQFENDKIEIKKLDDLTRALKQKAPQIKIGVLGSSNRAPTKGNKKTTDNATIGAVHEFGSPARRIPQRSFLRIPISEHLEDELEKSGLLNKESLNEVIQTKNILPWIKQIAVIAEGIVDDAFETQGFGQWPAWKNPTYTNEGGTLLVDSGQLRQSITTEISS